MVPPGIPDFITRERTVAAGPVEIAGRAWSGWAEVDHVDVSVDGGASWAAATLGREAGSAAWRAWYANNAVQRVPVLVA